MLVGLGIGWSFWRGSGPDSSAAPLTTTTPPVAAAADTVIPDPTKQPSIAVLPFVNMSSDKEQQYFSDGITEELINLLAKVPKLRVIARTSSFAYQGKDVGIAQIARELNVTSVLEGSVRKSGNTVRITAQLIRASDGTHLWSETYDRTLDDIFKVQDEIAGAVVLKLQGTLLGGTADPRRGRSTRAYILRSCARRPCSTRHRRTRAPRQSSCSRPHRHQPGRAAGRLSWPAPISTKRTP